MTYPGIIFAALILWSFFWPKERILYLIFGSAAFGSLAIFPPDMVAGVNVLPATAASLVLIFRQLIDYRSHGRLVKSLFNMQGVGLLTIFYLIAILSAFFFPRIFQYQVTVIPMRGLGTAPLQPTMANITQTANLTISFLIVVIVQFWAREERFLKAFIDATIVGSVILAITGILDFILGAAAGPLFAPFKTAQYAFLDGSTLLGVRRVDGLMTEASSFGAATVIAASFLLLLSPALTSAWRRLTAQGVGWTLVVLALLSTSSTAYVGVAFLILFYGFNLVLRIVRGGFQADPLLVWELSACVLAIVGAGVVGMILPEFFATPAAFLDAIIFKKSQTDSYVDRMMWNRLGMEALWSTKGVGVGLGGARTSNWAIAVLSNTGLLGAAAMFGFFAFQLIKPTDTSQPGARQLVRAVRFTLLVNLVMAILATPAPDFGTVIGGMFGILIAFTRPFGVRPTPQTGRRPAPAPRRPLGVPKSASA